MNIDLNKIKIAIVHDYLNQYGGAERVLEVIHSLFPSAPVYTLLYDPGQLPKRFAEWNIIPSFLNSLPGHRRHYQKMLSLFPQAIESFDLREYQLVISSSNAWAKGVITAPETLHICYVHTPMRFAWDWFHEIHREHNRLTNLLLLPMLNRIRQWDVASSLRPDHYLANSIEVQQRVDKYYRRPSSVIYPPVDTEYFQPSAEGDHGEYFLIVSRLKPYKKLDIAVEAFNKLGYRLVIVGEGSEYSRLKKMAGRNIEFVGRVPDEQLRGYYQNCKALIFPGLEDFGIAPVEAQSCGRPVIAYGKGGCRETVLDKVTGILFSDQTVPSLAEAVKYFLTVNFDGARIRQHAQQYDKKIFQAKFVEALTDHYHNHIKRMA